jgi:hypothetical protein
MREQLQRRTWLGGQRRAKLAAVVDATVESYHAVVKGD